MSKAQSTAIVKGELIRLGVDPSSIYTGSKHLPTKMNPDLIVYQEGGSEITVITTGTSMRERWQLHDWRAMRILTDPRMYGHFRRDQWLPLERPITFHLVITNEGSVQGWHDECANLSGLGLITMCHVCDEEKMKQIAQRCMS